MADKKSFWQTFPGVVTGIATILTAMLGLLTFFLGGEDDEEPGATSSPTPTVTATAGTSSGSSRPSEVSAPVAVVAPKAVEFGNAGVGRQIEQTVTIANSGSEYLVVEGAEITGRKDVFAVGDDAECLVETGIAPQSDCQLTVIFTPTSAGSYAGFLEIEHSAEDSPSRVPLNGEGVLLQL